MTVKELNIMDLNQDEFEQNMINKSRLRRADVWFNLNYFQESFSSLNRSFLESSEEDYNISSFTMLQQII